MDTTSPYYGQVRLLTRVLPLVAAETCFALKGGTAINLFIRDLPLLVGITVMAALAECQKKRIEDFEPPLAQWIVELGFVKGSLAFCVFVAATLFLLEHLNEPFVGPVDGKYAGELSRADLKSAW
ncbi:hypothetical protein GCM10007880_65630 [Mesorhizobium amorphae]|nr:hypothetical protein GCM10007880_65630 [Mesorhizobium amorphae]